MKLVNCLPMTLMLLMATSLQAQQANVESAQSNTQSTYQSLTDLQTLAENHVRNSVNAKVGTLRVKAETLDPRLHLAACPTAIESFLPSGASLAARTTVGVRCNAAAAQWTLYIGVNIETETPVLVLNHAVMRDAVLTASDVLVDVRRVPGLSSGYLTDVEQLKGYATRQNIAAGMVLTPAMLQPAVVVHRGQQVTVLANANGISVRAEAIALSDGIAHSHIRVRNLSTAKELEAVVDSPSVVRVEL